MHSCYPFSMRRLGTPTFGTTTVSNHLKSLRTAKGFSQSELAIRAGVTRQAISSIESNIYLPTTVVALRLASVLTCHVEDLFSLAATEDMISGKLVAHPSHSDPKGSLTRVKVSAVGRRTIVRPVNELGELLPFMVPADGYAVGARSPTSPSMVRVMLTRERRAIEQQISVAGCNPALFLAGEHLRRQKDLTSVVAWSMGSMTALRALQRGEVHVAGLHLFDPATGESNLPFLRQSLKGSDYKVVTFATWEEGFLVRSGNPKSIYTVSDLAEPSVVLANREEGSGARLLLDQRLQVARINTTHIRGYHQVRSSHLEVARAVAEGQADTGIGIRSAAQIFQLDFVPIQSARYDLVVPKAYLQSHPTLPHFFETLVSKSFRTEIEGLGGYDTSETGEVRTFCGG